MHKSCLADLKAGERAEIINFRGGRRAVKRLADLGLSPGTEVKVTKRAPLWGPLEIEVRGSRLALGRGLARKVIVRLVEKNDS